MKNGKVLISVDMEGMAAHVGRDDVLPNNVDYQMGRKRMTAEANAAIEGALAGGAEKIVVADSHSHMNNILTDELHEKAMLVRGSPRPLSMMQGLDETFDAAMLIGYHARSGDARGALAHTFMLNVQNIKLNGVVVGESGFNAALAGHFNVPVALASGDDRLVQEVNKLLPWVHTVTTKWSISFTSAMSLSPQMSQDLIREGAETALKDLDSKQPYRLSTPIELGVDYEYSIQAMVASDIPGVSQTGDRSVVFTAQDMLEVMHIWRLMINATAGPYYI
jgi:D-amino peptidase